jgi:hypothetical protein
MARGDARTRVGLRVGVWLIAMSAGAAAPEAAEPLRAARLERPPVIDGVLDDEAWQRAPRVTGFKTFVPDFGKAMADDTVAYYAYDAANLYFAFRALESEPGKIKASVANRDTIHSDDFVCINLDSFNDQQALYAFYVNPAGIQEDSRYTSGNEDRGFDAVWDSAARIDEKGFSVEIRIPLASIRYQGGDVTTMGIIFERFVSRRKEHGAWPELDPKAGLNVLTQMYPLQFSGLGRQRVLEVLPAATYGRQRTWTSGRMEAQDSAAEFGVTAKYGITAQLTADGTYNPDFSQIEADAGQIDINLRAPLFFPEKRPFFLEGREIFALGGPTQGLPLQAIVHTRTIQDPRGGVKVSGKLSSRDTMAALYSADELAPAGAAGEESLAQVGAVRYKRGLRQDSYLGGFYTGRSDTNGFNRVAGADGSVRIDRSSAISFYAFGSSTGGTGRTIQGDGHAVGAQYTRSTRRLDAGALALDISKAFVTETGYLTRNGVGSVGAWFQPMFYPTRGVVQRVKVIAFSMQTRDAFSGLWESYNPLGVHLTLAGAGEAQADCTPSTEVFEGSRFPTTGCRVAASKQFSKRLRVAGDLAYGRAIYYSAEPFGGRATRASASVVLQPSDQWSETLTVVYATFDRETDGTRLYDYGIYRSKTTFQANRYLLFRGILEYNSFKRQLITDFLVSFIYIPGTAVHAGYGSLYERPLTAGIDRPDEAPLVETRRGFFCKASYLWRF